MLEWENLKRCHDYEYFACVWVSSQNVTTIFEQSRQAMAGPSELVVISLLKADSISKKL